MVADLETWPLLDDQTAPDAYRTLRVTPAMEAGIADHVWLIEDIIELL